MHNACMSTLVQIRNVPEETHARLKARADAAGKSLNSYMLDLIERDVSTPTKAEILERIMARGQRVEPGGLSAAEIIRADREERDRYWEDRAEGRP
jgi:plasmid stability protein